MFCCFLILMVQFGTLRNASQSAAQKHLEELLYEKERQYRITRENMDLINIRCHDLKNWISDMQNRDGRVYEEENAEMQKALTIYDSTIQTGNEILDTILTEKKLYCEYNGILLTCIAEGERLAFFSVGEICSLFGNIMDNAIEAVSQIREGEKRTINLSVTVRGNLLSIHEENYYSGECIQNENYIETTKKDKNYHGFGLKSIRMITEKYHGNMSVSAENGVFNINLLVPLK